jgi:hypothetical protein
LDLFRGHTHSPIPKASLDKKEREESKAADCSGTNRVNPPSRLPKSERGKLAFVSAD